MKIHLTELRCHNQTLQLTLQVIQLTKPSELPPAQAEKAPQKLEQKTRSLEKRLLLRHFITKALKIRRAEVAAEEDRRTQAMKAFIRLPPVAPLTPIQPSISPESHPQAARVLAAVEKARQRAAAEQPNNPQDLLSNDIEDLIDFSRDFNNSSTQGSAIHSHSSQDLKDLDGLLIHQGTMSDAADKAESNISSKYAVFDIISEQRHLQSSRLASKSQIPDATMPDAGTQCQAATQLLKPDIPHTPQTALQFPVLHSGMVNIDACGIVGEQVFDTSPTTTATPSIFSHASTLSSTSGSSVRGITEAELRERDSRPRIPQDHSSLYAASLQPVLRTAMGSPALGSLEQSNLSSPHMTLSPTSSPRVNEDAESIFSAMSPFPTENKTAITSPELLSRNKSEDVIYQLDSTREPSLQDIDKPDEEGFPWLVQAAPDGDEIQSRRLIISGANLESVHATAKRSALCEASVQGHSNIVDLLIHEGCLTDNADAESYTALHHACRKGYLAISKSLLDAQTNIEALGPQGKTPLHLVAQTPHRNVVMLLLQRNANVNARDDNNQTPLHICAAKGNVEMCVYLLENGAQLDNRDSSSKTAIQLACEAGHYDTTEAMLKVSSLRTTELTFLTAFFAAVECGHVRIAESFFSRGLDFQQLNKNDIYKPATLAAKSGNIDMLELMIRERCNIKSKDDNDWNALHFATQHGHWQIIEPLVALGVSVKAATKNKDTPLILAVKGGHFATKEIFLRSKGVSVTVEDGQAQQPIHHATRAGSLEIFNLLISNGAKIAVQNAFGWHPIHIAVAYGRIALVDRLIEQSAKVEEKLGSSEVKKDQTHRMVKDGYWAEARWPYIGSRPLHLACEYGHFEIASNLISKDAKLEASCSEETEEGHIPQTLQFRTAGPHIPEEEKDKVRLLLQAAMDRTTKQPAVKGFKVGLKKCRTVEEKNNLIRAAISSMEMAAKSPTQNSRAHRPHHTHPPMLHSNTAPSALPSINHAAQITLMAQSSQLPLIERRISSASTRPSTINESSPNKATQNALPETSIPDDPSTGPSETKVEKKLSTTDVTPRSATTIALQCSAAPVPGLPSVPLNLMKNKFKLKRASTFGADISKQGLEKVSSGLGSLRQGLEKMSSYSLDVSKQGLQKVSSYGQAVSKQDLLKMRKQGAEDGEDDTLKAGQKAGGQQDATGDGGSLNEHSDEDIPYGSDGAESVAAFSMGGFDAYDDGGNDGGALDRKGS
ncbi:hypothetical protein MMC13_002554 [Lambiella insularis]|nr:hypothetical protein [Lambiella insularis]